VCAGRKYYANAGSQETRWEYPRELLGPGDVADWDERLDPNSGRVYYYNKKTQETSWTAPKGYEKKRSAEGEEVGSWQSKLDEASGRTYYYNTVTKATSWTRPASLAEEEEAATEAATEAAAETRESAEAAEAKRELTVGELVEKYAGYEFRTYAEAHFQLYRKGVFKSKTEVEKVTRWKNEVIRGALLNLKDGELNGEAVQMFRNVTGFMGDRGSGKSRLEHCQKILSNMLQSPEELRDEVYCQLVKQLTANPSAESSARGWQLLAACLATFPPSDELAPYLGSHCARSAEGDDGAAFCLRALSKICELGTRRELPTVVELESTLRRERALVRVFFLDAKFVAVPVDSWTTAAGCVEAVCDLLGVRSRAPFALFEASTEDEERALDPEERVLDLVAYWHRLEVEARAKLGKQASLEEFHFQFKVRFFLEVPDDDQAAVEMLYVQAKHDVVDARYPCSEQDAVTLAALQLQEEFGDKPEPDCPYLKGNLGKYLAQKFLRPEDKEAAADDPEPKLLKLYAKLAGYSRPEARLSYLDYVKSWKIYGSAYFYAEPKQNRDLPTQLVIAVNLKGLLLVDPDTKDFLQEYPYSQIVTWGHSPNSFVVVVGDAAKQTKIYFKTEQGREINLVVRAYVDNLAQRAAP